MKEYMKVCPMCGNSFVTKYQGQHYCKPCEDLAINGEFIWICTCNAFPEQYDIYYGSKLIAYFRYRHGVLSLSPYNDNGEIMDELLYEANPESNGGELTPTERLRYIHLINQMLSQYVKSERMIKGLDSISFARYMI